MANSSLTTANVPTPSARNQRICVRYVCQPASASRVYLCEDVEFLRAWQQNLSTTGIGLSLSKPLEIGLFLTVQVQSPTSAMNYSLAAHVVHATQQPGGDWLIGCQFVRPLTSQELNDIL